MIGRVLLEKIRPHPPNCWAASTTLRARSGPVVPEIGRGVATLCSVGDTIDEAEERLAKAIEAHAGAFEP